MSGKTDNLNRSYSDRISELGDRLHKHAGDEAMLEEIHVAIRAMLAENGDSESQVRQELQRRFDDGEIRPESFELVQKILDRIALEQTAKPAAPIPREVPLERTTKPDPANTEHVPLDQTVKIAAPFPQDPPPQDSSPTDEVPVGDRDAGDDNNQDFIDTAVLDNQAKDESAADDQLQAGSVLRDRFLLQEKLSGGSMGVVFKALDRRLAEAGEDNPYVAIKVLSSKLSRNANALRALQQEAAKGRYLSHPNIVRFIDLDREDDLYFIIMEWLEGRSLAAILDDSTGKKIDLQMALNVVSQISRALDYAHRRGVVHADVKPGNIIITPDGHAKLLDFGVARIRQKQVEGKSKFDPGVLGAASPAYSSMQVLTGEDPAPADDVFSLACLMYRLVAGMRVFGPRNAADAAAEGMEPQRPSGLNDEQWRALKKALSYSRVTRFPTPKAFMEALAPGLGAIQSPPKPGATPKPISAPAPRAQSAEPVMTATRDPLPDDTGVDEDDDKPRRSPWRLAVIGTILIASAAVVTQTSLVNYLDELTKSDLFRSITGADINEAVPPVTTEPETAGIAGDDGIIDAPPEEESLLPDVVETDTEVSDEIIVGDEVPLEDETLAAEELIEPKPEVPAFDYSSLPPATISVSLISSGETAADTALSIREDTNPATVELIRSAGVFEASSVVLEQVRTSGNRSPLESGQYALENNGVVNFAAGQERARTMISMHSDSLREPDRQVTLQVRETDNPETALAVITLTLEDDDQREFESGLLPNTVSFAVSQITVREFDPAVQVDVVRFKPDNNSLDVEYILSDVTATEGLDYFAPGFNFVSFGPGQRTARILIPLGQDARTESDEAFMLELLTDTRQTSADIFTRIAVMIRDDD